MSTKIKKILNFSFLKQKKQSADKTFDLVVEDGPDNVLDAAPDGESEKKSRQAHSDRNLKTTKEKKTTPKKENEQIYHMSDSEEDDSSQENKNFETHSNGQSSTNMNGTFDPSKANVINITNGIGIQFGNINNIHSQTNYVHPFTPAFQGTKKEEKSASVKALLKCTEKIETAHLEFLSNYLGKQWGETGSYLKVSSSKLEEIKKKYKESKERGYEMLLCWHRKQNQQSATIGLLCKLLWKSGLRNAREGVENMSVHVEDLS